MFVVSVVCCHVEVSVTKRSLVQRSPIACGVSLCGLETSSMRRPWPVLGAAQQWEEKFNYYICNRTLRSAINEF